MIRANTRTQLAAVALVLMSSCMSDGAPGATGPAPFVPQITEVVTVAPDTMELSIANETRFMYAELATSNGRVEEDASSLTWLSRNPKVASIPNGLIGFFAPVSAKSTGSTWIVASTSTARDSMYVRVNISDPPSKPVWHFTVAFGARSDAPIETIRESATELLAEVNEQFNIPGAFSGRFEFVLDSVFTYPAASNIAATDRASTPRSAQYLVLIDSVSEFFGTGGAYIGNGTVQLSRSNALIDPFSGVTLTHELGHARGAIDIYQYNIGSSIPGNPSLIMPASIMEAEGGSWDAMSRVIIDHNGGVYPAAAALGWKPQDFPQQQGVRVLRRNGTPVAGAQVMLKVPVAIPVASQLVVAQGTTNENGDFLPELNVFNTRGGLADPKAVCLWNTCLHQVLLVEVQYQGHTDYAWMTTADAVSEYARHGGAYLKKVHIGDPVH